MNNKKYLLRWVFAGGIVAITAGAYIFLPDGAKGLLKNATAVVVTAWNGALGNGQGGSMPTEIALGDSTSSFEDSGEHSSITTQGISSLSVPERNQQASFGNNVSQKEDPTADISSDIPTAADPGENTDTASDVNPTDQISSLKSAQDISAVVNADVPTLCAFSSSTSPMRKIILNEIAWMGSPASAGETASDAGKKEWMEIKNVSGSAVDLFGWQVADASGKLKIIFDAHYSLGNGNFFLLGRASSTFSFSPQKFYSGGLTNTGDAIAVFDPSCSISDFLDSSAGWTGGNNTTKQTLERDADHVGWHTSAAPGGTPGAENSIPLDPSVVTSSSAPVAQYDLSIIFAGDGNGNIASAPAGLVCGLQCKGTYASGTLVTLTPVPGTGSFFAGWSDPCFGATSCPLSINRGISLTATFRAFPAPTGNTSPTVNPSSGNTENTTSTTVATSSPPSTLAVTHHLVIAAVQVEGASSTNDFVKLYNPTGGSVSLGGWKLRKKSKTGTDSSLREMPAGSTIRAGSYFVWANSEGGFAATIGADASSTATLTADNSIAILNASGTVVDALAWGTGTDQYVEGSPYPTSPGPNQILKRKIVNCVIVDGDNNASDFAL